MMTEREKIIKVIDEWASKAVKTNKFDGASVYNPHNAAELADALIAANFGDVKETDHRAEVAERALRNCVKYYLFTSFCPVPDCDLDDKCWGESCRLNIAKYFEEQAEKELTEGKKQ